MPLERSVLVLQWVGLSSYSFLCAAVLVTPLQDRVYIGTQDVLVPVAPAHCCVGWCVLCCLLHGGFQFTHWPHCNVDSLNPFCCCTVLCGLFHHSGTGAVVFALFALSHFDTVTL